MRLWPFWVLTGLLLIMVPAAGIPAPGPGDSPAAAIENEGLGAGARVFVSPRARERVYEQVVIMPFRAPTELAGASITDLFTAELEALGKYRLVERTQMEQALSRQTSGPKELIFDTVAAINLGKTLGVPGVIVGTVPEYEVRRAKKNQLAAIGITVRLIDVADGSLVWSLTDTAVTERPISLSSFAQQTMRKLVSLLFQEMVRAGDLTGVAVPTPRVVSAQGQIRGTLIEIQPDPPGTVQTYKIMRGSAEQGPYREVGLLPAAGSPRVRYEESGLPDGETYFYRVVAVAPSQMTSRPTVPLKISTAGPPGAVPVLTAQSDLIRKVVLSWQPLTDPQVRGYRVLRQTGSGPWEKIKDLEGRNQGTFTDQELGDQVTYAYKIVAVNQVGAESPPSPPASAVTKGPPGRIQKLEALSLQPRKIPLKWSLVNEPEVKGYAVYRATKAEGPFEKIAFVEGKDAAGFVDGVKRGFFGIATPLLDETRYYYKVCAVNIVDVPGPESPTDNAVTKPVPEPVLGLQAGQMEVKQVSLQWQASEETDVVKYQIFRGRDAQAVQSLVAEVQAPATRGVDQQLEDGSPYYYQVRAVDQDGLEGKSSTVVSSVTKPVPVKPRELKAQWEGQRVRLTWAPNPEKDIQKYTIAQKSFLLFWEKIGKSSGTEYYYQGEWKKGKRLSFRITAIDQDRLEGEPSEEAEVTVP